ncbi:MAG: pyruvate kinase, partial [Deltaproteobacteria bacterium]|nr:pyruvate kinase [Deltaproteobacteria bacterium]
RTVELLRQLAARAGRPIAILGDLCGPKIRLGKVPGGPRILKRGEEVRLRFDQGEATEDCLCHTYEPLARDVQPGDPIYINDGLVRLVVLSTDGTEAVCRVEAGGSISDRKGINLPATRVSAPSLSPKDIRDLELARALGLDYIALSFVRSAQDVKLAQELADGIPVIAKIEKPEAVDCLESILDQADGAMIARGDLGVELGQEKVPLLQKRIIQRMLPRARPVITATQMLESMIENAAPTRAEVSDVANAVLDGTDAVMLSGETSVGRHPGLVVRTMARIIEEVEQSGWVNRNLTNPVMSDRSFSSMIAEAVSAAAREYGLTAMAVYTESGRSAALAAAERPKSAIAAFSRHDAVLRRLNLHWGVTPLRGEWVKGVEGVVEQAERELVRNGLASAGDTVAVTFGMRLGGEPFQTNMLKLWKIRRDASAPITIHREEP